MKIIKNLLLRILILFIGFSWVLAGCGFRGPLYLPAKPAAGRVKMNSSAVKPNNGTVSIPASSLNTESNVTK